MERHTSGVECTLLREMTITLLLAALRVTKLCYASNGINTARRGLVLAMVKGSYKAFIYANWMS